MSPEDEELIARLIAEAKVRDAERDSLLIRVERAEADCARLLKAAEEDLPMMQDASRTVQSLTARAEAAEAQVRNLEAKLNLNYTHAAVLPATEAK
jgi:hypothetical protein